MKIVEEQEEYKGYLIKITFNESYGKPVGLYMVSAHLKDENYSNIIDKNGKLIIEIGSIRNKVISKCKMRLDGLEK